MTLSLFAVVGRCYRCSLLLFSSFCRQKNGFIRHSENAKICESLEHREKFLSQIRIRNIYHLNMSKLIPMLFSCVGYFYLFFLSCDQNERRLCSWLWVFGWNVKLLIIVRNHIVLVCRSYLHGQYYVRSYICCNKFYPQNVRFLSLSLSFTSKAFLSCVRCHFSFFVDLRAQFKYRYYLPMSNRFSQ